mmetsp:Transcript_95224/g.269128  ORF Transcript_95224/g.269128 Transcript_95224/m.269128 type:complete len:512 (+) Transcript_95224:256-1791(+)
MEPDASALVTTTAQEAAVDSHVCLAVGLRRRGFDPVRLGLLRGLFGLLLLVEPLHQGVNGYTTFFAFASLSPQLGPVLVFLHSSLSRCLVVPRCLLVDLRLPLPGLVVRPDVPRPLERQPRLNRRVPRHIAELNLDTQGAHGQQAPILQGANPVVPDLEAIEKSSLHGCVQVANKEAVLLRLDLAMCLGKTLWRVSSAQRVEVWAASADNRASRMHHKRAGTVAPWRTRSFQELVNVSYQRLQRRTRLAAAEILDNEELASRWHFLQPRSPLCLQLVAATELIEGCIQHVLWQLLPILVRDRQDQERVHVRQIPVAAGGRLHARGIRWWQREHRPNLRVETRNRRGPHSLTLPRRRAVFIQHAGRLVPGIEIASLAVQVKALEALTVNFPSVFGVTERTKHLPHLGLRGWLWCLRLWLHTNLARGLPTQRRVENRDHLPIDEVIRDGEGQQLAVWGRCLYRSAGQRALGHRNQKFCLPRRHFLTRHTKDARATACAKTPLRWIKTRAWHSP